MNKNQNNRRSRGRGSNKRHGNVRNQTFESNGPGVKVRGSAQQVLDKYLALARDASSSGDRIIAESYFQFAEHYFRLLNTEDQRNADRNGGNRQGTGRERMETPGSAQGGPDDLMTHGDYDDDMDNDDDMDEANAEVIHTDRPRDGRDNDGGNDGDRDDTRADSGSNAAEQREAREQQEARPPRAPRGRRRKAPAGQSELPMNGQPEPPPGSPAANDAAD